MYPLEDPVETFRRVRPLIQLANETHIKIVLANNQKAEDPALVIFAQVMRAY